MIMYWLEKGQDRSTFENRKQLQIQLQHEISASAETKLVNSNSEL